MSDTFTFFSRIDVTERLAEDGTAVGKKVITRRQDPVKLIKNTNGDASGKQKGGKC